MMVAASSLLNLEQHHNKRYTNSNPLKADLEMAYQISQLSDGSCSFEQRSVFNSQNTSLQSISDQQFCMPASTEYQESGQKRSDVDSKLESPNEENSSSSPLEGSISPRIKSYEYVSKGGSYGVKRHKDAKSHTKNESSFYINNRTNDCIAPSRSPSHQYSPPAKRIVPLLGSSAHTSELNHSDLQRISCDSPSYSSMRLNSTGNKQMNIDNGNVAEYMETTNEDSTTTNSSSSKGNISYSSLNSSSKLTSPSTMSRTPTPNSQSGLQSSATMKPLPNFFFDDDDDDSWKICGVCGDKATGYHFNALTCEGCKGFFRRCMKNGKSFTCPYTGNCSITKSNRRQCQSCRLQKCLKIGMKKECIMSSDQILMKKNLVLNNRIKRNIQEWKPRELTEDYQALLEIVRDAHIQTNNPPPEGQIRNKEVIHQELNRGNCSSASPASSNSSGFSDLINSMTQDIVATAPGNAGASKAHMQHFSDIMEFSIKEIIKFCKKIPIFTKLGLKDQITLLKSGCTEILFIKANYTYDRQQNAMSCGPGKYYTRQSFILGGMSEDYTDCYLKFHHDLSHMQLDETEMSCLCAVTLFSSDRDEVEEKSLIENQQEVMVLALQSYVESVYHCRERFPKIMSYLTRLRTLNWHISNTLKKVQQSEAKESVTPLVLEVIPSV